ncbi:MAG: radical SAM protein [Acidobacteriota bacterium]|nr:radical SAM protein [Acidobacteriota bacterium]MDH3522071.1 radical SAM protein [Acidobacteriota bacterium]
MSDRAQTDLPTCADSSDDRPFCEAPFRKLLVAGDKQAYLCCWAPQAIGDLTQQTSEEAWNSSRAQDFRASIHDGTFRYCDRGLCPWLQADRLPRRSEVADPYLAGLIASGATEISAGFSELLLGYDRSCNLACPSCRPGLHSAGGDELDQILAVHENVVGDRLQNLHGLEKLFVSVDGDAFTSRVYRDLLFEMKAADFPELRIRIMTNGLLFTPRMWERLAGIRDCIKEVVISIDAATPETYEIVRKGGSFAVVLENLRFLGKLYRDGRLAGLSITFVVQRVNYREMRPFAELGASIPCGVTFIKMMNPGHIPLGEFVHDPAHPEHADLLETLKDPILRTSSVNVDAFADLLAVR